jgi:4'-phosphopantetheinyl transferase
MRQARSQDDALAWRAAHIAMRLLIERWAGPRWRGHEMSSVPGARPQLDGAPLSFNLSHSPRFALVGLSMLDPIGVDIEEDRDVSISPERRAKLISYASALVPDVALPADEQARFLQSWVRIEALSKADGRGIGPALKASGASGAGPEGATTPALGAAIQHLAVRDIAAGPGIFAAAASATLPEPIALLQFPTSADGIAALI